MSPLAHADGHDAPGLVDEFVPCVAAMVEDVVVGCEDAVGQPVVAHELPDILDRIEFRRSGRQRQQGDVVGDDQPVGHVPASLIEHDKGMSTRIDRTGDLVEVELHGCGVAPRQDEARALALRGTDGTEDIGRFGTLVVRRPGARAASCPAPCELVLLADPRLILPPQLYCGAGRQARPERRQFRGEIFLYASSAYSFCA